jgi:hypothetical protein
MRVGHAESDLAADHIVNQPSDDFLPPPLQGWFVRTAAKQSELSGGDVSHVVCRRHQGWGNLLVDAHQIQAGGQKLPEQTK